jgi:hypothetical protein
MVLDKRVLHKVLKAKERISVIKDNIVLGRAFRFDFFRNPAKTLIRIGNPLQILSRMRHTWLWFEIWEYFRTITEVFGSLER